MAVKNAELLGSAVANISLLVSIERIELQMLAGEILSQQQAQKRKPSMGVSASTYL